MLDRTAETDLQASHLSDRERSTLILPCFLVGIAVIYDSLAGLPIQSGFDE